MAGGNDLNITGTSTVSGGAGINDGVHFGIGGHNRLGLAGKINAGLNAVEDFGTLIGGHGNDVFVCTGDQNQLFGGIGNDSLTVTGNNNAISGGSGASTLAANGAGNTLFGGSGNDWIGVSGNGNVLDGGSGNDTSPRPGAATRSIRTAPGLIPYSPRRPRTITTRSSTIRATAT
jgi:Ca2+-binding RTX toxin-like protein